jgi:hypothetical protein
MRRSHYTTNQNLNQLFFCFWTLFAKHFHNYAISILNLKMDPYLGVVIIDAEITRNGANINGAEAPAHRADVALTWPELGADLIFICHRSDRHACKQ